MRCAIAITLAGILTGTSAPAREKDARTLVAEANQAMADGDCASALVAYQRASLLQPASSRIAYNQGVASYRLGDYAAARDAFNRALGTREFALEAKAKFNLGNVAFAWARDKAQAGNAHEAVVFLKRAIRHYRDALESDPEDEDAQANIEFAQRLIKDLIRKLRHEGGRRRKSEGAQGPKEERQEHRQGDQPKEGQDPNAEQRGLRRQMPGDEMQPEEAEQLLQAVRDKERQRREALTQRQHPGRRPVVRDW